MAGQFGSPGFIPNGDAVTFPLTNDKQVYCWLRKTLEPTWKVVAEPDASYYSEFQYCYRVCAEGRVIQEFRGDFRSLRPGELAVAARDFVDRITAGQSISTGGPGPSVNKVGDVAPLATSCAHKEFVTSHAQDVIASRLIPFRTDTTFFSSGRAAFCHLLSDVLRPRRVWLPTFVCWSLIAAMQQRFPQIPLLFYTVDRELKCHWPLNTEPGDALVFIHFFGQVSETPMVPDHCTLLEDVSHLLITTPVLTGAYGFGSLRKLFRIADGGQLLGRHCPVYEPDDGLSNWLRANARDWRDLREAENMMDRDWKISDMSSQSLATLLASDVHAMALQRQRNQRFLAQNFPLGQALLKFDDHAIPLLHNVCMPDVTTRDSLRSFLAQRGIFCSIHWPLHPVLRSDAHAKDSRDAAWLADHVISIPVADDFNEAQMARICEAAADWDSLRAC